MQRCDITWAILQLKALGIDDVLHFDFLSPPPSDAIVYAVRARDFSYVCITTSCSNDYVVNVVGVVVQLESDRRERKDDGSGRDDVGDASG
jgi:hypothetical protein